MKQNTDVNNDLWIIQPMTQIIEPNTSKMYIYLFHFRYYSQINYDTNNFHGMWEYTSNKLDSLLETKFIFLQIKLRKNYGITQKILYPLLVCISEIN